MEKENFVKKINEIKKANKLDLSVGEDLSIGLMNMISLEEHFLFSYMKTEEPKYLEFLEQTREVRKRLLAKIVNKKEGDFGEQWCISKHLLSTSMRLTEVGTKYLHDGKNKEAEEIFMDAFNMYSMFWEINGFLDSKKAKSFVAKMSKPEKSKLSNISNKLKGMLDCCRE
jgi:hypothetical protein